MGYRQETEKKMRDLGVIAAPHGFHGRSSGLIVMGSRRDTKEEALADAVVAQDWIDSHPYSAPHAWREIN